MFIIEFFFELIFQILLNSIGAALRWLFFFGKYSYNELFHQEAKNIVVAMLIVILLLIGFSFLLEKNLEEDIEKPEISLIIKTKLSKL